MNWLKSVNSTKTDILPVIILALFLLIPTALSASPPGRNKPLAILLSAIAPGMGQLSEGRVNTGLAVWTGSSLLTAAFFLTVGEFDLMAPWYPSIPYRIKAAPTDNEKFWAIGIGVTWLVLYVYNLLDTAYYKPPALTVTAAHDSLALTGRWSF